MKRASLAINKIDSALVTAGVLFYVLAVPNFNVFLQDIFSGKNTFVSPIVQQYFYPFALSSILGLLFGLLGIEAASHWAGPGYFSRSDSRPPAVSLPEVTNTLTLPEPIIFIGLGVTLLAHWLWIGFWYEDQIYNSLGTVGFFVICYFYASPYIFSARIAQASSASLNIYRFLFLKTATVDPIAMSFITVRRCRFSRNTLGYLCSQNNRLLLYLPNSTIN